MPKTPAHQVRRKPGWFHPVPVRARCDGWSVERQCWFLAHLYLTGSVAAAARAVGMSRESAYRLRARAGAESFAFAWDRVLALPGTGHVAPPSSGNAKVTLGDLIRRLDCGFVAPLIYRGRMVGIRKKPDNSALLCYLSRTDAAARRVTAGEARW